jgi:hypothetical protein
MSRASFHPHIARRIPPPSAVVSLSELRRLAEQRGLQLVVANGLALLDGGTVVHRSAALAEVAGWLEGQAAQLASADAVLTLHAGA